MKKFKYKLNKADNNSQQNNLKIHILSLKNMINKKPNNMKKKNTKNFMKKNIKCSPKFVTKWKKKENFINKSP